MTDDKRKAHPIPPQGLGIRMQAVSNAHLSSAGWCYVPTGPGLPSAEEQMETLRHELNARGIHAESYAELQERIEPGAKDYLRPYATGIALYVGPGDHVYMLRSAYRALPSEFRGFLFRRQACTRFYITLVAPGLPLVTLPFVL